MDLTYLVQIDPVYSLLCNHLPTRDRINLQNISSSIRNTVRNSPNTWQQLDFSGRSRHVVLHYLQSDVVNGALENLILDCTDVESEDLVQIFLSCPNIRSLGLGGSMNLMSGALEAVILSKRQGYAKRLKHVGLLGAPQFKTTAVNPMAASISQELKTLGVTTDLVPCRQEHAFTSRPDEQWHLCCEHPSSCCACGIAQQACSLCLSSRTCRGCFRFWCFDCDSRISRVCYECKFTISARKQCIDVLGGHSCPTCKEGIYVKCMECGSMFCKLHRGDDRVPVQPQNPVGGRTQSTDPHLAIEAMQDTCDWCIQGRCRGFGH